ncbi:MAG: MBL fold metallo-hydrolase [Candidatus Hodarchaeota archaeon]
MSLTFYGGVGEIGGNKIRVKDDDTCIFFDFGKNFERERRFFDQPYLAPREEKHLFALGILPYFDGLYKYDEIESDVDGIILSHAHTDHTGYVGFVKDEVPIYCSELTKKFMIARDYSSTSSLVKYRVAIMRTSGNEIVKDFTKMNTQEEVSINEIKIKRFDVDHSIPGASAFIYELAGNKIAYTGDLRQHGDNKNTEDFLKNAETDDIDILITEGTNVENADLHTEEKVSQEFHELLSATNRCTIVSSSLNDFDRLNTIFETTKACDKKLVISIKQAFILSQISEEGKYKLIDLNDDDLAIFQRQKSRDYEWEKTIIGKYGVHHCNDFKDEQDNLVLMASFFDMNEMCDFQPKSGAQYVISQSEPHNEEMEIDRWKLMNWLENYGLPSYSIHCSGHIRPLELMQMIERIHPKKIIPIHTERPKIFEKFVGDLGIDVDLPMEGKPIVLN